MADQGSPVCLPAVAAGHPAAYFPGVDQLLPARLPSLEARRPRPDRQSEQRVQPGSGLNGSPSREEGLVRGQAAFIRGLSSPQLSQSPRLSASISWITAGTTASRARL